MHSGYQYSETDLSVHKFGGTSMASIEAMRNSAQIVSQIKGPVLIVVSAAAGITRALMHLSHPNTPRIEQEKLQQEIVSRHREYLVALKNPERVQDATEALLNEVVERSIVLQKERSARGIDALLSIGERLSSLIFTEVLREMGMDSAWFDARLVMKTNEHFGEAQPILSELQNRAQTQLLPLCAKKIVVTQGFIGSTLAGETTTLGKESSDYSAALFAEALGANHFAIWSDMPGVFTADPKRVATARPIKTMSMQNALALTEAGAKVLHPHTMLPALRANMAFFVGSSQGLQGGTWVQRDQKHETPEVTAINLRQKQILLTFHHHAAVISPLIDIIDYFAKIEIQPAYMHSDPLCTQILVDDSLREFRRESRLNDRVMLELQLISPLTDEGDMQLIAIVGNLLDRHARLREVLATFLKSYNIRVLSLGMNSHSVFILVREELERTDILVKELHDQLFGDKL